MPNSCNTKDPGSLPIIWSEHAAERALERFGLDPDIRIPVGLIQLIGSKKPIGEKFRVRAGRVVYMCVRDWKGIIIKTIMKHGK